MTVASPARVRSQREVFGETLAALAHERDDVLVLDGDLANSTRADIVAERAPHAFREQRQAEHREDEGDRPERRDSDVRDAA